MVSAPAIQNRSEATEPTEIREAQAKGMSRLVQSLRSCSVLLEKSQQGDYDLSSRCAPVLYCTHSSTGLTALTNSRNFGSQRSES
jgi:hypothetical protein